MINTIIVVCSYALWSWDVHGYCCLKEGWKWQLRLLFWSVLVLLGNPNFFLWPVCFFKYFACLECSLILYFEFWAIAFLVTVRKSHLPPVNVVCFVWCCVWQVPDASQAQTQWFSLKTAYIMDHFFQVVVVLIYLLISIHPFTLFCCRVRDGGPTDACWGCW